MKRLLFAMLLMLCAASLQAGTIIDVQTGVYATETHVDISGAVVTELMYNGFFVSEIPNAAYAGVWVYDGGATGVAIGDIVDVGGLYQEYYSLTEINVYADGAGYVTVTGTTDCLTPLCVTVAQLNADPEAYESCWVRVMDGMMVTTVPSGYGIWEVESYDTPGEYLLMDDYWYDDGTVLLGDCYFCATGIYVWNYDEWKLDPHVDGLETVDCSVSNETMSFGQVKSLFR